MTAPHDLTADDLQNFLAMQRAERVVAVDKTLPTLMGIYGAGGLIAMLYLLDLTLIQFFSFTAFLLGFAWLTTFNIKRAAARGIDRSIRSVGGPRVYTIGDSVLETQTPDSRVWTRLDRITDLRSNARGTLVCLGDAHPLFLPFGHDYRPDFITALRAALPKGVGEPPPLNR